MFEDVFLPIAIVGIIFGSFMIVAVTFIKAMAGKKGDQRGALSEEDTENILTIMDGLQRMEKRVESIETILSDHHHAQD